MILVQFWNQFCHYPYRKVMVNLNLNFAFTAISTINNLRSGHLRRNYCWASLRRNYFTCDGACAGIIFKR